jgi:hypothetical protein
MKAVIKSVHLIDHESWNVDLPDDGVFRFWSEAMLGTCTSNGEEIFSFSICSPKWVENNAQDKPFFAQYTLITDTISEERVREAIASLLDSIDGSDWTDLANKISKYLRWEFDDYQETTLKK